MNAAFSTGLGMKPSEEGGEIGDDFDGFGTWAPTFSCLVSQVKIPFNEALALPVCRAFVLISTMRRNQGWRVIGTPYALRDMKE